MSLNTPIGPRPTAHPDSAATTTTTLQGWSTANAAASLPLPVAPTSSNATADLVELHRAASSTPTRYPDDRLQSATQAQAAENNDHKLDHKLDHKRPASNAESDTESAVVDGDDSTSRRASLDSSSSAEVVGTIETAPQLRQKLRALERQQARAELQGKEKEAARLQKDIDVVRKKLDKLDAGQDSTRNVASPSPVSPPRRTAPTPAPSPNYDLNHIRTLLRQRLAKLPELRQAIVALEQSMVDGDDADHRQAMQELGALQQDIGYLQELATLVASGDSPQGKASPGVSRTTRDTPTTTTTTTVTTTTTTATTTAATASTATTAATDPAPSAKLSDLHRNARNSVRNSSLLFQEDLRPYFSDAALEEIKKIDKEIEERADRADEHQAKADKLRKQLDDSESEVEGRKGRERLSGRLGKISAHAAKEWIAINKLLERRAKLEGKVIPQADAKSLKQIEAEYQAFVTRCKSVQTLDLEARHKKALTELEEKINAAPGEEWARTLGAGAAGFGVSFFLSNSLSRLLPAFIPAVADNPWIIFIGAPVLAGTLHVITATPVVKQVMTRVWSSNSLSALNNNFKLRGAYIGDQRRGELDVRKYDSKDPTRTDKLTIQERLAEEAPFDELFAARYKDEEAGYWCYTMNYWFKALAAGVMSDYMAGGSTGSKILETGLHAVAGFCSGALYLVSQQHARSQRANAKATVVPTQAVYTLEATALQSLRDDLLAKQAECRAKEDRDPSDQTERLLTKALRRTNKALIIATAKSRPGGIMHREFWAQFDPETWRDTLSEVLGRIVSLAPTAMVNELTSSWRKSPVPWLMFLGHALPALVLIMPPGFTSRPLYSGAIRAMLQSFIDDKTKKPAAAARAAVRREEDDSLVSTVESGQESSQASRASRDLDESVIVSEADDMAEDSDEAWHGNPTKRDEEGGW